MPNKQSLLSFVRITLNAVGFFIFTLINHFIHSNTEKLRAQGKVAPRKVQFSATAGAAEKADALTQRKKGWMSMGNGGSNFAYLTSQTAQLSIRATIKTSSTESAVLGNDGEKTGTRASLVSSGGGC